MATDAPRYGIEDLATLGGVTRRTVRYYVQEGLLPAPFGVGRGRHYGSEHLDHLLRVKAMQEAGQSLDAIRRALAGPAADRDNVTVGRAHPGVPPPAASVADVPRSLWRRLVVAPGVELLVASDVALPPPAKLHQLADWCRAHFRGREDEDGNG